MNRKVTEGLSQTQLFVVIVLLTVVASGCAPRIHAPMQPDDWSAQSIVIMCHFAPDTDLDPATGKPMGDEGYFFMS